MGAAIDAVGLDAGQRVADLTGDDQAAFRRFVGWDAGGPVVERPTPEELAAEIGKHVADFAIDYEVDPVRQAIAESWPRSIDDSAARAEWDWAPAFDLGSMTADMLEKLGRKLKPAR